MSLKSILVILTSMNSLDLGSSFVLQFIENREWRCYLSRLVGAHMVGTFPMSGMISVLRYHMTKMASKAKLAKGKPMTFLIIVGSVVFYGTNVGLTLANQVKNYFFFTEII